jgi:choice-of-anchor A domain-containing protein
MRFASAIALVPVALALVASPSLAATPIDYNLFVLDGIDVHYSDTQGAVAAGGNASFTGYSIGNGAPSGSVNLVVGGNLSATNGSTNGLTIVAGTPTYSGWSTAGLQASGTPLPIDFVAAATELRARAIELSTLAPSGSVASPWTDQWLLTGASSGLSVFNLDAAAIATSNTFTINLTPGTQALINVNGADARLSGGLTINGGTASDVLWNFYNASTLSFSGIAMQGSVLAPNADYLGGWGQINGTLIVNSFSDRNGATELHNGTPYRGGLLAPLPPIPEPASWAMMIAGFGLVGAGMRRRAFARAGRTA